MPIDPRTPVIVGAASLTERFEDPLDVREPLDAMAGVIESAAEDAGAPPLLKSLDEIWTPRGFWAYSNPGKLLGDRFGAPGLRSVVAEIGVLQSTLLGQVAARIQAGEAGVVAIVGAEAKDRAARLRRQGQEAPLTEQTDSEPDRVLRPSDEIMGTLEIQLGLVTPTIQYALIDNALRASEGQSLAAHQAELGQLWSRFSEVAANNPHAWNPVALSPSEITTPTEENRLLAYPYTKSLVSQWNVNQAAALLLCSYEKAISMGLDASRFIYPLSVVDSEHMVTLTQREALHRSPGFQFAGERALAHLGKTPEEIDLWELYSCFPAAVRVQQREMGIDPARPATLTGGMTFGGGPLNNFVLQGWARMVETMRAEPGRLGGVTSVSGLITKQGVSLLGPEPFVPFRHEQVTEAVAAAHREAEVLPDATGRARVATCTVGKERGAAQGTVLIFDLLGSAGDDGPQRRTLRVDPDPALAERAMTEELIGCEAELRADGTIRWLV